MRTVDIPPLCTLGHLSGLSDWTVSCRCWITLGIRHYQFIVQHPNGWILEYRCLSDGQLIDSYWCSAPQSSILTDAVEDYTTVFIKDALQGFMRQLLEKRDLDYLL